MKVHPVMKIVLASTSTSPPKTTTSVNGSRIPLSQMWQLSRSVACVGGRVFET